MADLQCQGDCGVDEPYDQEIMAGGVLCGACGRRRSSTKYTLASHPPNDDEPATEEYVEQFPELACYIDSTSSRGVGVRIGEPLLLRTRRDVCLIADILKENR